MCETEATKSGDPGPPPQTVRGIASWNVVKSGTYRLNVDMQLASDTTQEQHY